MSHSKVCEPRPGTYSRASADCACCRANERFRFNGNCRRLSPSRRVDSRGMNQPRLLTAALLVYELAINVPPVLADGPRCVEPEDDIRNRQHIDADGTFERVEIGRGRGRVLLLATSGYCGSGGCEWAIYGGEACRVYLGTINGTAPRAHGHAVAHGMPTIFAEEHGGAAHGTQSLAEFNGREYVVRTRECAYGPSDPPVHCAPWH